MLRKLLLRDPARHRSGGRRGWSVVVHHDSALSKCSARYSAGFATGDNRVDTIISARTTEAFAEKSGLEVRDEHLAWCAMFVRRKIINGRCRNYAVFNYREGGKVRQRQFYLGECSSIAERILDLEDDLGRAQSTVAYHVRKIGESYHAPRPYRLESRASAERKLASVKAALERLNMVAKEHGLLPTKAERAERVAAKLKREEEIELFFSRYVSRRRVVPTGFIAQRTANAQ